MATPTNKNDCTNKSYVDQKILESHVRSHQNRKNVFKYLTDHGGEFSSDYGIYSVNLINNFNDMPHKVRKKSIFFYFAKV